MAIAFISDLHLTPEHPDSGDWFRDFMEQSEGKFTQIYILGDLFEVWVGDDGAGPLGQEKIQEIIRKVADSGVELFFIHGNRDFLIGEDFEKQTRCKILPDPSVISLGGTPVLLSHGDAFCTDDIEHQEKRAQMVTSKWKIAFLNKPLEERIETALEMRQESERNKRFKPMEIMDVNQAYLEKVMLEFDVQTLIHGHTHRPAVHDFELNGKPARRFVLGDWYTQKSMLIYDNGSFSLRN
jgi:UDP-2,3-diacylglucosamine hydrolase